MSSTVTGRLISLPIQLIRTNAGALLKRGIVETCVSGPAAYDSIRIVMEETSKRHGATAAKIRSRFSRSSRAYVDKLLHELITRRFLLTEDSHSNSETHTPLSVYYWHFMLTAETALRQMNRTRFILIGTNSISRQLVQTLQLCGAKNLLVFHHPQHLTTRFVDEQGTIRNNEWPANLPQPQTFSNHIQLEPDDCIVATSDSGIYASFYDWNRLSLDHGCHFIPIILKDMIGYVGPLVVPGESACFQCFSTRLRSNSITADTDRLLEESYDGNGRVVGFHPAMASILGDIAAFILTTFYSRIPVKQTSSRVFELNLLAFAMTERRILRLPRCPACSPLRKKAVINLYKTVFPN